MDFFTNARIVRLRSHLDKYLYADEDEEKVRQSRQGSSPNAKWEVEFVQGSNHVIRLKSCYGRYLTAIDVNYLTGITGKKVIQTLPTNVLDLSSINWEPIRDRYQVKFMISGGKYLRANGGPQPWRNTITHDIPNRTITQVWVLWIVDTIDIIKNGSVADSPGLSITENRSFADSPRASMALPQSSPRLSSSSSSLELGFEIFRNVKTIRLKSQHGKYLVADENEESVSQDVHGSSSSKSKWTVELAQGGKHLRLKSCYGRFLTASNSRFITGLTGKKVLQTSLSRLEDSGIDWQPIKVELQEQKKQIKLMTRDGNFLRANRGFRPYKNSVTHDIPLFNKMKNWVFWDVEILEFQAQSVEKSEEAVSDRIRDVHVQYEAKSEKEEEEEEEASVSDSVSDRIIEVESESIVESEDFDSRSDYPLPPSEPSSTVRVPNSPKLKPSPSFVRKIYFQIDGEDDDDDDDAEGGWNSFVFKGNTVEELTHKLEEVTRLEDITVCLRSEIDDQLYPLRRHLPRNNAQMHVVVVHQASPKVRNSFAKRTLR